MLARLWWKEWRGNWPLLVAVALMAAGVQWTLELSEIWEVQTGALTLLALGFAAMYAFAIGSTAFAAERESRALGWLDTLPVSRPTLWTAKASFALGSTAALTLALVALAASGTVQRDPVHYALTPMAINFGVLLVEAIAWSFFWSALMSQTLAAAALAVATVGLILAVATGRLGLYLNDLSGTAGWRLSLALGALAASWVVMTRRPRPGRPPRVKRSTPLKEVRPVGIEAETKAIPAAKARPAPRMAQAPSALRALVWETWREARKIWGIIAGVSLLLPVVLLLIPDGRFNLIAVSIFGGVLASLIAGVCVFALEDRARTYRFYLQLGVRPARVWVVKEAIWIGLMLPVWVPLLAISQIREPGFGQPPPVSGLALCFATAFAAGQLCEMVLRRAITAALVGGLLMIALLLPQALMVASQLVPAWWLGFTPLILLLVSWAWSGDWLDDRPGLGRWARLALHLAVPYGLLAAAYIDYRARSVPDIAPPFSQADLKLAPIPEGANAADTYTLAIARRWNSGRIGPQMEEESHEIQRVISEGWDPNAKLVVAWWRQNQRAIELTRHASEMEQAEFAALDHLSIGSSFYTTYFELKYLADALALDARERQFRGDLAGAWEDIRAIIRMAGHMMQRPTPIYQAAWTAALEGQAVQVGLAWAADPRQTPAGLRAALKDLGRLPELPKPTSSVLAEYVMAQRALDDPSTILSWFYPPPSGRWAASYQATLQFFIAAPWEIERARRVVKLATTWQLQEARSEAWERARPVSIDRAGLRWPPGPNGQVITVDDIRSFEQSTPLSRQLIHEFTGIIEELDRETIRRRILTQVIALRVWALEHGGREPERLADLVPSVLERLPIDPYSGRPFGYVRSSGQVVSTIRQASGMQVYVTHYGPQPTRPGQWLLYSIGPDGIDNRADSLNSSSHGDIVFPLPVAGP